MSQIAELIGVTKNAPYKKKRQYLQFLCQMSKVARSKISPEDKDALMTALFDELEQMHRDIPETASYLEKTLIFDCADNLFGILWNLNGPPTNLAEHQQLKISALVRLIKKEKYLETLLEEVFKQPAITDSDINRLLYWAKQCTDEYQRGQLFLGLGYHQNELHKLSTAAKELLTDYLVSELRRLMTVDSDDARTVLKALAGICGYFFNDAILYALQELLQLGYNSINSFAVNTLLHLGEDVPQPVIDALASDPEYAHFLYQSLQQTGKTALFPAQYAGEENLAKSALVSWLTYPTELGMVPEEIEYIGKIKVLFKKDAIHVFKFRSHSDTLEDAIKGKWLVGWSTAKGSSFSHFDELAALQGATTTETLNAIKKTIK